MCVCVESNTSFFFLVFPCSLAALNSLSSLHGYTIPNIIYMPLHVSRSLLCVPLGRAPSYKPIIAVKCDTKRHEAVKRTRNILFAAPSYKVCALFGPPPLAPGKGEDVYTKSIFASPRSAPATIGRKGTRGSAVRVCVVRGKVKMDTWIFYIYWMRHFSGRSTRNTPKRRVEICVRRGCPGFRRDRLTDLRKLNPMCVC